jgi:curved DNA-binding protein
MRWQPAGGDGGGARLEIGDDLGGFSSFFESLFGGGGFGGPGGGGARGGRSRARAGSSVEAQVTIPLADAYHGAKRSFAFETTEVGDDGRPRRGTKTYDVKIPPGTREGSTIRLQGQGAPGAGGGPAGDLYLRVSIAPDPRFTLDSSDLHARVKVAPHEAALGAKVPVPTMDGEAVLTVPAGSSSGRKLRLRGLGLPRRGGERGDLIATLEIAVPRELGAEERAAYEALARVATDPRSTA